MPDGDGNGKPVHRGGGSGRHKLLDQAEPGSVVPQDAQADH